MSAAFVGLIATIIGAIIGAFINEMYKRHRDACATAAALAGELASYRYAYRALDVSFPILIERVQAGQPLNIPAQDPPADVAFQAYVDKIGLLGPDLAEKTSFVYGQIRGFRSTFFSLTRAPAHTDSAYLEAALRVGHMFMTSAQQHSVPLIETLRQTARTSFGSDLVARAKTIVSPARNRSPR